MHQIERSGRVATLFPDIGRIASPEVRDSVVRAFLIDRLMPTVHLPHP